MGYRVTAVSGGAEALDYLSETPGETEIVVTDFDMPGLSGVEFAEHLLEFDPDLAGDPGLGTAQRLDGGRARLATSGTCCSNPTTATTWPGP